jgi:hypothetical protein
MWHLFHLISACRGSFLGLAYPGIQMRPSVATKMRFLDLPFHERRSMFCSWPKSQLSTLGWYFGTHNVALRHLRTWEKSYTLKALTPTPVNIFVVCDRHRSSWSLLQPGSKVIKLPGPGCYLPIIRISWRWEAVMPWLLSREKGNKLGKCSGKCLCVWKQGLSLPDISGGDICMAIW